MYLILTAPTQYNDRSKCKCLWRYRRVQNTDIYYIAFGL